MYDEIEKFLMNCIVVSFSAATAKTIAAPLERVKLILQNQNSALQVLTGERPKYRGMLDCLIRLPKEQGFLSYWRGNGTSIMRYIPTQAINFAMLDVYKKIFYLKETEDPSYLRSILIKFASGGFAGACGMIVMYPLELCVTRIAVDVGSDCCDNKPGKKVEAQPKVVKREFLGLFDCVRKIRRTDGIQGLYNGFAVGVLGVTLYRALYFGLFDAVKHLWAKEEVTDYRDAPKPPVILAMLFAQSVTCMSGLCAYPLDTVARRVMLDSGRPKEMRLFKSSWGAFPVMYKNEGFSTFYKGSLTNCVRGMSGALVLVFYDEILHYTQWKKWISPCDNC